MISDIPSDLVSRNLDEFFAWLKRASEDHWRTRKIDPTLYGYQFQPGTTWKPGIPDQTIERYQNEMGLEFPFEYKMFLRHMNGTTPETVNVYGSCGQPYSYGPGYYSYPEHLTAVKDRIRLVYDAYEVTTAYVDSNDIPHLMPIESHRFLVVDRCSNRPVLSIYGRDAIVLAPSLQAFLIRDIFGDSALPNEQLQHGGPVPFWLDNAIYPPVL